MGGKDYTNKRMNITHIYQVCVLKGTNSDSKRPKQSINALIQRILKQWVDCKISKGRLENQINSTVMS